MLTHAARWTSFITLLFAMLVWLLPHTQAKACSCMRPPPPLDALKQADAVFEGRVVRVPPNTAEQGGNDMQRVEYEFAVSRTWKGPSSEKITLQTTASSAACGRSFQLGETYLVYSHQQDGIASDHLCSRTSLASEATEDFAALGSGQQIAREEVKPSPEQNQEAPYIPSSNKQPQATPAPSGCSVEHPTQPIYVFFGCLMLGFIVYVTRLKSIF